MSWKLAFVMHPTVLIANRERNADIATSVFAFRDKYGHRGESSRLPRSRPVWRVLGSGTPVELGALRCRQAGHPARAHRGRPAVRAIHPQGVADGSRRAPPGAGAGA